MPSLNLWFGVAVAYLGALYVRDLSEAASSTVKAPEKVSLGGVGASAPTVDELDDEFDFDDEEAVQTQSSAQSNVRNTPQFSANSFQVLVEHCIS